MKLAPCGFLALVLVGCSSAPRASTDVSIVRGMRSWDRLKTALPGTWRATAPSGGPITVSYRLVAGDSALLESFVTPSGRETITMIHPDGERLLLTHYCGQGNQPRLVLHPVSRDAVSFTMVDATNVLRGQAILVERTLRFVRDGFEQIELYRQPDGSSERTSLMFTRADR
ncbi:MAG: hypothetical protein AB7P03_16510 [Kofleriaceae bacterium]